MTSKDLGVDERVGGCLAWLRYASLIFGTMGGVTVVALFGVSRGCNGRIGRVLHGGVVVVVAVSTDGCGTFADVLYCWPCWTAAVGKTPQPDLG